MIAGLCLSNGSFLDGQVQKGALAGKEQHVLKLEIRDGDRRCWLKKEDQKRGENKGS